MSISLRTDALQGRTLAGSPEVAAPGPASSGKAIERGAVGLLTKPIDFGLLRQEIDTRLGQAA